MNQDIEETIVENTEDIKKIVTRQYNLDRQKRMWDALFYAHQRMDVLIISISGGGIYTCLETVKYLKAHNYRVTEDLTTSAILFVIAIITNFIAQKLSSYIYSCDFKISDIHVLCDEAEIESTMYQEDIDKADNEGKTYDRLNKIVNWTSITTMLVGLIFLLIFFLFTF